MKFTPTEFKSENGDSLLPILNITSADKAAQFRDKLLNQNMLIAAKLTWADLQNPPFGLQKLDDYKTGRALFPLPVVVYLSFKMGAAMDDSLL